MATDWNERLDKITKPHTRYIALILLREFAEEVEKILSKHIHEQPGPDESCLHEARNEVRAMLPKKEG